MTGETMVSVPYKTAELALAQFREWGSHGAMQDSAMGRLIAESVRPHVRALEEALGVKKIYAEDYPDLGKAQTVEYGAKRVKRSDEEE